MYFNHNVRFLIYSIVLTDVKARIQPVNPTVFVIDPKNIQNMTNLFFGDFILKLIAQRGSQSFGGEEDDEQIPIIG